ncbi:DUF3265 domain-containing protein [Vibrio parahaemolyticus]|nr:DUF3265 domain-containing protein [Vibrio parahaemolyticus]
MRVPKPSASGCCITNCLRVILNAWHFYYALSLVIKVVCGGIGIALLTP